MRRKLFTLAAAISLALCLAVAWRWRDPDSPTGIPRVMLEVPLFRHVVVVQELTMMQVGDEMIVAWMPGDYKQMEAQAPPSGAAPKRSMTGIPPVIMFISAQTWNGERAVGMMARHWFLFLLTALLPLMWITREALAAVRKRVRARRMKLGLCLRCGYDLRGTPQRCPECGAVAEFEPRSPHNPPLERTAATI